MAKIDTVMADQNEKMVVDKGEKGEEEKDDNGR